MKSKEEKFVLSEKIKAEGYKGFEGYIEVSHVKEFIKILKEEITNAVSRGIRPYLTKDQVLEIIYKLTGFKND